MKKTILLLTVSLMISVTSFCQAPEDKADASSSDSGKTTLLFVGASDIQKSLNEGDEIAANTGIGVIFRRQWPDTNRLIKDFEFNFSINIASTVDSIRGIYENGNINNSRDFGIYVLLPMNSGQATRFNLNAYFVSNKINIAPKWISASPLYLSNIFNGVNIEFVASNRVWTNSLQSKYATGMLGKIGVFHEFVPNSIRLTKGYSIKAGVSYSFRGIYGDVGFDTESSKEFRKSILGTEEIQFHGWEFDLGFRLKNIEARVSIPYLYAKDSNVPGLSGTQFITSISFIGGFPISLQKGVN